MERRDFVKSVALSAVAGGLPLSSIKGDGVKAEGKLKKAVLISMLPKEMSFVDRFKLAVDVGFEGIEAQTVEDPKIADEIKEASAKANIPIHSVMNMEHWASPLSSPDPAVVAKSVKGLETSMRNAKLWGASTVLLVPAVVRPDTTYRQAWERSQVQVKKMIPLAKELGVVIAIEEVWNKFLLTPHDMAKYIDEFKSPWVQGYCDVGNMVFYGYPEEWIRVLGKRITRFHLKDFDRKTNKFVPLREGSIDWKEVRKAIGDIGYSGFLTVELGAGDKDYLKEVSKRVDLIFAGE